MNKTYKKSDITKLKNESTTIEEDEINELINADGTMLDRDDNFKATTRIVRSKKTTDDFIRGATQGPEAYFIYGGPYYGINYSYKVNEEKTLTEEEDTDLYSEQKMKNLVDEIIHNKKSSRGMVKRSNEQDIMGGLEQPIPDISELKQVHQKPMVIRKMNLFLDLIHKEGLNGDELAIVLNHIMDNVDIDKLNDEYKEIIGDKIKYGDKGRE